MKALSPLRSACAFLGSPRLLLQLATVAVSLVLWQAVCSSHIVSADFLPPPGAVLATARDLLRNGYRDTTLPQDAAATVGRCLAGFALALVTGVPLGLVMGLNRWVRAGCNYVVQFMRPLPPLSYLVLLILWLGTGNASKIALLYMTAFPIIASAAMAGVRGVRVERIRAAQSLGASRCQIVRHVVFPSALPAIFTGLRIALAAAFSTVVAAELMAAQNGLGWMIFSASQFLRTDIIVLGILLLGALGMALSALLALAERRIVHWRGVD